MERRACLWLSRRGSGEDCPQAVGEAAAFVADLLLGPEMLFRIKIGLSINRLFESLEGDHLFGLGILCRYRHKSHYAELRIMPIIRGRRGRGP